MARRKDYFNFTDFNYVDGAIDLFHNTIRGAFQYDALTDDVFQARVLTEPTPIVEAATDLGAAVNPTAKNQKYSFRVRILGDHSPHRFLEDPCLLENASSTLSADNVLSIIQNHTQVILYDEGTERKPKTGDIVNIKLGRSGNSYNIKRAKQYIGIASEVDGPTVKTLPRPDCSSLIKAFKSGSPLTIGASAASYTLHFDPTIPPFEKLPVGTWAINDNFWTPRSHGNHGGIDVGAKRGDPLYAVADGQVESVNDKKCYDNWGTGKKEGPMKVVTSGDYINLVPDPGRDLKINPRDCPGTPGGNSIVIAHPSIAAVKYRLYYAHVTPESALVTTGDMVTAGQEIGKAGSTGNSSGPHLHLELWVPNSSNRKNPAWHFKGVPGAAYEKHLAAYKAEIASTIVPAAPASGGATGTAHPPAPAPATAPKTP